MYFYHQIDYLFSIVSKNKKHNRSAKSSSQSANEIAPAMITNGIQIPYKKESLTDVFSTKGK